MLNNREKIRLISGRSFWTFGIETNRGLPVMTMSDGPAGLRMQYKDEGYDSKPGSRPAVCYPSAAACAASFDTGLMRKVGRALGSDARENGADVLLGPALNLKRNPLCGRNFEYYSEDPVLSGEMAAACVRGIQSTGTAACIKHFAANSQETRRAKSNSVIDAETLFDLYLKGFEIAIRKADPEMVMLAYNKLNGVYCCENKWLVTDVLRGEFGFKGATVSDWGAVDRLCASINAGLDLRMPGGVEKDEEYLRAAVRSGKISKESLDRAADRLVKVIEDHIKACRRPFRYDRGKNIDAARKMAEASAVLLKNENMLPLSAKQKILVVGEMAKFPKYRGGGSGGVKLSHAVTPWNALRKQFPDIAYSRGYKILSGPFREKESNSEEYNFAGNALINEACRAAADADCVLVFAGLPETYETEGIDRETLSLPYPQDQLIERLSEVNDRICVIVSAGSAVLMPWADRVRSIFMCYPMGSCTGDAMADLISGKKNPSGRLPETFPYKLSDLPSAGAFPARNEDAVYHEGKYVGYRYFTARERDVQFPFGYGLSYTTFAYGELQAEIAKDELILSVDITNTGRRRGSEAVQFYISHESEEKYKELIAFEKVALSAGETKTIQISVPLAALKVYDASDGTRVIRKGKYSIAAAASCIDIKSETGFTIEEEIRQKTACPVPVNVTHKDKRRFTRNTSVSELEKMRPFRPLVRILKKVLSGKNSRFMSGADMYTVLEDTPIRQLPMGTNGRITAGQVRKAADLMEKIFHRK